LSIKKAAFSGFFFLADLLICFGIISALLLNHQVAGQAGDVSGHVL
jgi:hypothetical protein